MTRRIASAGLSVSVMALAAGLAALGCWPSSAGAQAPSSGFASAYSSNADKPVDITADQLEVDDKKKIAIFRGNVSATQGEVNLKSAEIWIAYKEAEKKPGEATGGKGPPASPLGGDASAITRIDAKGDVLVTMTPAKPGEKPQQTKSDWAIFDVEKQQITLGGNVVLAQGDNVMSGSTLVVDLTTGLTRFDNSVAAGGSGRIKATFEPPPKGANK
jgi:lipopolysaccharide export system protein LptA